MIEAGKLDRRITIQRATFSRNEFGEQIQTWATLAEVWCARRRASARETLAAAEISAQVSDVFEIRYSPTVAGIDAEDRLIFESRIYDIQTVDEIGRRVGFRIGAAARGENDLLIPAEVAAGPMLDFSVASNSQYIGQVV